MRHMLKGRAVAPLCPTVLALAAGHVAAAPCPAPPTTGTVTADHCEFVLPGGTFAIGPTDFNAALVAQGNGSITMTAPAQVATQGDNASGVFVQSNGTVTFTASGNTIDTVGDGAYGIHSFGASQFTGQAAISTAGTQAHAAFEDFGGTIVLTDSALTTGGYRSAGVATQGGGTITLQGHMQIATTGDSAPGLYAINAGSKVLLDPAGGTATIQTMGADSPGAMAQDGGSAALSGPLTITTGGSASHGLYALNAGSTVTAQQAGIHTTGSGAYGATASGGGVQITGATVQTEGSGSHALAAIGSGSTLDASEVAATTRREAYGAWAGDGGRIGLTGGSVHTTGEWAFGLYAGGTGAGQGQLAATGAVVQTGGFSGHGAAVSNGGTLALTGGSVTTQGERAFGLIAWDAGARITADGLAVTTTGPAAHGVAALDGTQIDLHGVTLRTSGVASNGLYSHAFGANAPVAITVNGGTVRTDQAAAIRVAGASLALSLKNGATVGSGSGRLMDVLTLGGTPGQVLLSASQATLQGDVFVDAPGGSRADLLLADGSVLGGAVSGARQVTLDASSQWKPSGNSTVERLLNAGSITFTPPGAASSAADAAPAPSSGSISTLLAGAPNGAADTAVAPVLASSGFRTLTVRNYTGLGGALGLNATLAGDGAPADRLVIDGGQAGGRTRLRIANAGGSGALTPGNGILVVDTTGGGGTQPEAFSLDGRVVAGPYEYRLQRGSADARNPQAWYLLSTQPPTPPAPSPAPAPPAPPAPPRPLYRPEIGAYLVNQRMAGQMFVHSLHDRQAEPAAEAGAAQDGPRSGWLRLVGQHEGSRSRGGDFETRTDTVLLQGGTDLARIAFGGETGRLHAGLMAGYGRADSDAQAEGNPARAQGRAEGIGTGAYATWFQNDATRLGAYADTWLQYGWFDQRVNGELLPSVSYRTRGWAASGEAGYAFALPGGWVIEPQAQLIRVDQDSQDVVEPNGTRIAGTDPSGWLARLGLRLAHRFMREDGRTVRIDATLNAWHGETRSDIAFSQMPLGGLVPADRYELKLGLDAELGGRWTVWLHATGAWGAQDFHQYGLRAGLKRAW